MNAEKGELPTTCSKHDGSGVSTTADTRSVRRCYLDPVSRSDVLLVVFSGHFPDAKQRGYDPPFEFMRFLGRHPLGVHTLFVRDMNQFWYLSGVEGVGDTVGEIAAFLQDEKEILGAQSLCVLGSSMGGYAALLFGHLLKADVALAFGPQIYLDRATRKSLEVDYYSYESTLAQVESAARTRGVERYLKITNLLPLDIGKVNIHIGQNEAGDINQAKGLNDQHNVKFVLWPGGNHMVVKALRDEGKLLPLLRKHFCVERDLSSEPVVETLDAESLRSAGNKLVQAGEYEKAIDTYSAALQACDGSSHHLILGNRALCMLKLKRFEEGWHDADAAVCLDPKNVKALYRRAQCEVGRDYIASAQVTVQKARKLDPDDKALRALEVDIKRRLEANPVGPRADSIFAGYCE